VHTYLIGKEETLAYARDFVARLKALDSFPEVWCPITKSGSAIAKLLWSILKTEGSPVRVQLLPVAVSRKGDDIDVSFRRGDPAVQIPDKSVLILDGAIHSGRTMIRCADEVLKYGPKELLSYSLIMKAGSSFVPTIWGVTIDETDRAFFLLDEIPNHRLDAGSSEKKQQAVHIERLDDRHRTAPPIVSKVASMDSQSWGARIYQMKVSPGLHTYVLVRLGKVIGYLTIRFADRYMAIDELAVDEKQHGHGYGGVLLRFADTLARQANCRTVQLNAIDKRVSFYEEAKYQKISNTSPIRLDDDEIYWPMERTVLYHQRPDIAPR
jgi:GNAT superfamily N-acetyltransferase/hypoxanthine phosphoribosyltransferase